MLLTDITFEALKGNNSEFDELAYCSKNHKNERFYIADIPIVLNFRVRFPIITLKM